MSRIVKAAAVQISPDLTSREKTLARVLDAIDEAAGNGADLIVFPETFVPFYPYFRLFYRLVSKASRTFTCMNRL